MAKESDRKRLPPYISYRTFENFLERLQQGVPSRIDRSYWSDRLSGSTGTQLMAALRFMRLVDARDAPSSRLRQLAQAKGVQRADVLTQLVSDSFNFVTQGSFDFQSATYAQLDEAFKGNFELTDGVRRKCVKFFVSLANDAGMPLSSFITKRIRLARSGTGTKPVQKRKGTKANRNVIVPLDLGKIPLEMPWDKLLLEKFPVFDLSWSDEVKLGWFHAFDILKFPAFDLSWSDEVKLGWFQTYDKLVERWSPRTQT